MRAQGKPAGEVLAIPKVPGTVLAASLTLNILSLLLPIAILQIFDRVIPFQSEATLLLLFIGLCVGAGFEFILRWTRAVLLGTVAERFSLETHAKFLDSTLGANTTKFRETSPAVHMERFAAIARLRDHYSGQARHLAMDLPFTAVFILMIALIGGWLVIVPLASAAGVLAFTAVLQRAQAPVFRERKSLDARRYTFLAEILAHMPTVKANTMEQQLQRRLELLQQKTVATSHRLILLSGLSQNYGAVFSQLSVAGIGLFGTYLVIEGQIGIAELAACMLLNGRTVQPLMKLLALRAQSENIAVSRHKLEEALSQPVTSPPRHAAPPMQGRLEIRSLGLNGARGSAPLISGLTATVEPGQRLLLDGADGWRAEGIFDLLLAQRNPTIGELLIDGQPPEVFATTRGEGGIVTVDATPVLFVGTILENISAFGNGPRIDRALALSKELALEDTIHRLPAGYNTRVGDGGAFDDDLSNGQLISLVRALAMRPQMLLLNEPGAPLEDDARAAFARTLSRLTPKPTVVIATPDPRLKSLADIRLDCSGPVDERTAEWRADGAQDASAAGAVLSPSIVEGAA